MFLFWYKACHSNICYCLCTALKGFQVFHHVLNSLIDFTTSLCNLNNVIFYSMLFYGFTVVFLVCCLFVIISIWNFCKGGASSSGFLPLDASPPSYFHYLLLYSLSIPNCFDFYIVLMMEINKNEWMKMNEWCYGSQFW